jgi:hypothetical protein
MLRDRPLVTALPRSLLLGTWLVALTGRLVWRNPRSGGDDA